MGLLTKVKTAGSYIFNFNVRRWVAYDEIKDNTRGLFEIGRSMFTPEQANFNETFEEAMQRLNITEDQLMQRRKEFMRLAFIFTFIAVAIFTYSVYIAYYHKNIMGFIMGFCITLYTLTHVFRYHFWIYQIKHRKLQCTLKEWFNDRR